MQIKIVENSFFAHMATRVMKCNSVAIVFGKSIHLWNVSRKDFLRNPSWVAHELKHVRQYERYGFGPFCCLYLLESVRKGYYKNRFEVDARTAEERGPDLSGIEFV